MLSAGFVLAGRYRVIRLLGGGGMKRVYLAEDAGQAALRRVVVEPANDPGEPQAREQASAGLQLKAQALEPLRNGHLAQLLEFLTEDGRLYLIREYVEGESLEERIRRMPKTGLAPEFVIGLALQILDGLVVLHGLDPPFIYRNLKPSNVIIGPEGVAKLVDFGLALDLAPPSLATKIGARPYSAPEQYERRDGPQSDLYALGAIMHHALSGRDPVKSAPFRFQPLERLRPDLNPDLCKLVDRSLAFNVNERVPSAQFFKDSLLAIKAGQPLPAFAPAQAPASPVAAQPGAAAPARPRSRRAPCPHCQRRIPRDARTCPYCARNVATGEIGVGASSSGRKIPAAAIGIAAVAAAVVAGVFILRPDHASSPAVRQIAAPASVPSHSAAEAEAEAHRLALARQFDADMAAFRGAEPSSHSRERLRRTIIAEGVNMNPPPGLPQDALQHLDRGDADLKARNYAEAAGEFREALDEAPWLAQAYRGLARARESAGDLDGEIEASNDYLLASPQASDALEVKAHAAALGQRIFASQSDAALRNEIQALQVKQQEEEAEQARIRAQEQAEEEARQEQQRQNQRQQAEQQRQQVEREQRCRENFVGRWGEYDVECCGERRSGATSFLPPGSGGRPIQGLGGVYQIDLAGKQLQVYRVLGVKCSRACESTGLYQTSELVFDGTLTNQRTNWSGNCSFTATGEIHHFDPFEAVPIDSVDFYVSDDGSTLTWGSNSYRRQ